MRCKEGAEIGLLKVTSYGFSCHASNSILKQALITPGATECEYLDILIACFFFFLAV